MKRHIALLGLAAALLLSACGGGHHDETTPPADGGEVPDSALASSDSFSAFVGGLSSDDSVEPLSVDKVDTAPRSDTTEPTPLD